MGRGRRGGGSGNTVTKGRDREGRPGSGLSLHPGETCLPQKPKVQVTAAMLRCRLVRESSGDWWKGREMCGLSLGAEEGHLCQARLAAPVEGEWGQ